MENILFDEWEDAFFEELIQTEEQLGLTSTSTSTSTAPKPPSKPYALPPQPPPSTVRTYIQRDAVSFSPPRKLDQRTTTTFSLDSPTPTPNPHSAKDLEIQRLKRELEQATKQIENLEKEHVKLKRERDKKEDQPQFISSRSEEQIACAKCSKSNSINKDSGILAPHCHKVSSKIQNGVSSSDLVNVETDKVSHHEAKGVLSDDLPAYLDLSQKLLAIWASPTDIKMGNNVISKLLVACQRDFHILFGCMNMSMPSEITGELLADVSPSGVALHYLKDRVHTPEAAKISNLYLALTKIADGTNVLETLIEPLLDLCGMENVVIVYSSLCVLHVLLKLMLELEKNVGRSALCSGTISSLKDFALEMNLWIPV